MNLKPFFVDALTSALELEIGRPEDVLRHVTPDVLSIHLPRPLWARLLTACLGAPKVDATLIVETIGVPNLCEHVPSQIIWNCIADIASRSLGKKSEKAAEPVVVAKPAGRQPLTPPPPEAAPQPVRASSSGPAASAGPAIPAPAGSPLADIVAELEADLDKPATAPRARTPTSQRFRSSSTGINRPIGTAGLRRPQVQASSPPPARSPVRRGATEVSDHENETYVDNGHTGREIAVDDSQLVDWQSDSSSAAAGANDNDDDFGDIGRKR